MLGRVGSTKLFLAAGGNCVGALIAGGLAHRFGITAPYWAGFAVAVAGSVTTWRGVSRAAVASAFAPPLPDHTCEPPAPPRATRGSGGALPLCASRSASRREDNDT